MDIWKHDHYKDQATYCTMLGEPTKLFFDWMLLKMCRIDEYEHDNECAKEFCYLEIKTDSLMT